MEKIFTKVLGYECSRLFFNQKHILICLKLGILNDFILMYFSLLQKLSYKDVFFERRLNYKLARLASYGRMLFIVIYFSMIKLTNRP